jgi:hypothetical protein
MKSKDKKWVRETTFENLLNFYRFGPSDHRLLRGENAEYLLVALKEKHKEFLEKKNNSKL